MKGRIPTRKSTFAFCLMVLSVGVTSVLVLRSPRIVVWALEKQVETATQVIRIRNSDIRQIAWEPKLSLIASNELIKTLEIVTRTYAEAMVRLLFAIDSP